jgi:hypothetical protein
VKRITIKRKVETEVVVSDINTEEARHIPWLQPTSTMYLIAAEKNVALEKKRREDEESILEEASQVIKRRSRCVIL